MPRDHIDIAALITDLDSTVKVLENLDDELRNPASRRLESFVAKDVEIVLDSLNYSDRLYGTLFAHEAKLVARNQSSYKTLWNGFTRHVEMIESTSMPQRLDWYRSILQEAITTLRGQARPQTALKQF